MELIGSDKVLCLLADRAMRRSGQKLGRDRRCEHIEKHCRLRLVSAGICHIAHEVADKRLRDIHEAKADIEAGRLPEVLTLED